MSTEVYNAIIAKWLKRYDEKPSSMELDSWIARELENALPDIDPVQLRRVAGGLVENAKGIRDARERLRKATARGMGRAEWLYRELRRTLPNASDQEFGEFLKSMGTPIAEEAAKLVGQDALLRQVQQASSKFTDWNEHTTRQYSHDVLAAGVRQAIILAAASEPTEQSDQSETAASIDVDTFLDTSHRTEIIATVAAGLGNVVTRLSRF